MRFDWVWVTPHNGHHVYGETPLNEHSVRVLTKWLKDYWGWYPLDPYGDWNE